MYTRWCMLYSVSGIVLSIAYRRTYVHMYITPTLVCTCTVRVEPQGNGRLNPPFLLVSYTSVPSTATGTVTVSLQVYILLVGLEGLG